MCRAAWSAVQAGRAPRATTWSSAVSCRAVFDALGVAMVPWVDHMARRMGVGPPSKAKVAWGQLHWRCGMCPRVLASFALSFASQESVEELGRLAETAGLKVMGSTYQVGGGAPVASFLRLAARATLLGSSRG
jgi:hypothetical protein